MSTGDRGTDIYRAIDSLDEAKTVTELAARIKPILDKLAWLALQSDGAIHDAHEEWREEYTDRLYEATGRNFQASNATNPRPAAAPARPPPGKQKGRKVGDPPVFRKEAAPQPPPTRPPKGTLTPALQKILDGSHESFTERDD